MHTSSWKPAGKVTTVYVGWFYACNRPEARHSVLDSTQRNTMDKSALAIPTMAKLGLAAAGAVWMGVVTSSLVALTDNQLRMVELMGKSVDLVGNLASITISTEGKLTALENSVESGNTPPVSPPLP